uniref:Phosphoribosylaminoimidazole carboxylase, phosphoribosylaminoimidazole succinocarboxamide synthetase n=1 Tax=Philodina roseola TaxID=96448 RepID=B2L3J0_PHIRO|nr:phosphoribosylaminoimidazole carboxylase, phosphoribosylaminoimidazole succinocarboxamide synthetase [Philodina roseola]
MASSVHEILGQKLFDGRTKTIYSMIDQPGLICIFRKDFYQPAGLTLSIPGSRRSSIDCSMFFLQQQQQKQNNNSTTNMEIPGKGVLITSITTCVYEILREASIPTFYVAPHPQPAMFIARKCTMIPILWIVRRLATETYIKRNPSVVNGHRFVPPIVEIYHKRHPLIYRRLTLSSLDENVVSSHESLLDDDDSDVDECLSSIWSYDQLLNAQFDIEDLKITQTEIEYMYETCCTIFDILEHIWMVKKNCQLIDLKLEFGITTTTTKEIVLANAFDIEAWHILRATEKNNFSSNNDNNETMQENLIWINNALRDILDLNINIPLSAKLVPRRRSLIQQKQQSTLDENDTDEDPKKSNQIIPQHDHIDIHRDSLSLNIYTGAFSASTTNRCVIVCSSIRDIEYGQKLKVNLNETFSIPCELRLCSIYKSAQTMSKFISNYSYEHCRPTIFVTIGNINNGLAMFISSNSSYPVIHCSLPNSDNSTSLIDSNSFHSSESSSFPVVFSLTSAAQNIVQILAISDWKLWAKQRGRRLKSYLDLLVTDQQLTTIPTASATSTVTQTSTKMNSGILSIK